MVKINAGECDSNISTNELMVRLDERVNNMMTQIKEFTDTVQRSLDELKVDAIARDKELREDMSGHVKDIDTLKIKMARAEGGLSLMYLIGIVAAILTFIFTFT